LLRSYPSRHDVRQHFYVECHAAATERISIVHQMENLLTFPEVERKVKAKELQIHGWYYRIEDGTIEYYDGEECSFKPLKEN
jgi:carbonic anhydrase